MVLTVVPAAVGSMKTGRCGPRAGKGPWHGVNPRNMSNQVLPEPFMPCAHPQKRRRPAFPSSRQLMCQGPGSVLRRASRADLRRGRCSLPASCPCSLPGWEQDAGRETCSCQSHDAWPTADHLTCRAPAPCRPEPWPLGLPGRGSPSPCCIGVLWVCALIGFPP